MEKAIHISHEDIERNIYFIHGKKVMLDRGLASLYGVETKVLNQAVTRNLERFPVDFMFQVTKEEFENWKSQIVTSKGDVMGLRKLPRAFTEQGVAMLSSVLRSKRAIVINIEIMRTFTKLREMLSTHRELQKQIDEIEKKYSDHDNKIRMILDAIKKLMAPPEKENRILGLNSTEGISYIFLQPTIPHIFWPIVAQCFTNYCRVSQVPCGLRLKNALAIKTRKRDCNDVK